MFFDEVQILADHESGAHRIAVIFADVQEARYAIVAFGIFYPARPDKRVVIRLVSGENLDVVDDDRRGAEGAAGIDPNQRVRWDRGARSHQRTDEFLE